MIQKWRIWLLAMNTTSTNSVWMRLLLWMKAFPRSHKIITLLILIYLLLKCVGFVVFKPWVNPFADDLVTIRGSFPFDKGYELIFNQTLETTIASYFCGGTPLDTGPRHCSKEVKDFIPKRIDGNTYELIFHRDQFFSGLAGWKFNALTYRVFRTGSSNPIGNSLHSHEDWERAAIYGNIPPSMKPNASAMNLKISDLICADDPKQLPYARFQSKSEGLLYCTEVASIGHYAYDKASQKAEINFKLTSNNIAELRQGN